MTVELQGAMAELYKVMDPDEPQTSGHFLTTNWDLCVLCQDTSISV